MSQSDIIFGVLVLAFLIYITAKGELKNYIALLTNSQQTSVGALPVSEMGATVTVEQGAENLIANNPLYQVNVSALQPSN